LAIAAKICCDNDSDRYRIRLVITVGAGIPCTSAKNVLNNISATFGNFNSVRCSIRNWRACRLPNRTPAQLHSQHLEFMGFSSVFDIVFLDKVAAANSLIYIKFVRIDIRWNHIRRILERSALLEIKKSRDQFTVMANKSERSPLMRLRVQRFLTQKQLAEALDVKT
jgi:hypothetical protein